MSPEIRMRCLELAEKFLGSATTKSVALVLDTAREFENYVQGTGPRMGQAAPAEKVTVKPKGSV